MPLHDSVARSLPAVATATRMMQLALKLRSGSSRNSTRGDRALLIMVLTWVRELYKADSGEDTRVYRGTGVSLCRGGSSGTSGCHPNGADPRPL